MRYTETAYVYDGIRRRGTRSFAFKMLTDFQQLTMELVQPVVRVFACLF